MVLVLSVLSGVVGVASALAFLKGGATMPWSMQTLGGETEAEKAFRVKAKWWNRVGLWLLAAAFALSTLASITEYLSAL